MNFVKIDLPIGDLADDIIADSEFPVEDDFGEILTYMQEKSRHNSAVVETFCEAWNYYVISTSIIPRTDL